jgi:hypothetical protein
VIISPDGRDVYVSAREGVVAFIRNRRSGVLTALAAQHARGFAGGTGRLAISADGGTVYGAGRALVVLGRDGDSGELRQLPGSGGCVNGDGSDGCATARGLAGGCCSGLVVSADSRNVYVSATQAISVGPLNSFTLDAFARDPSNGALTQLPGEGGCMTLDGSDGCLRPPNTFRCTSMRDCPDPSINAAQTNLAGDVAMAPDGAAVYLIHDTLRSDPRPSCFIGGGVSVLKRDPGSGSLGALELEVASCGRSMTVSPDGRTLYGVQATGHIDAIVVPFLQPRYGSCVSSSASDFYSCVRAPIDGARSVTITPDGRYAYVVGSAGIEVFNRRRGRPLPAQPTG